MGRKPKLASCLRGKVVDVIKDLKKHQKEHGLPDETLSSNHPANKIGRAITDYTNQKGRMNYPEYRRRGLPITSSHIESTIKLINVRVKGTEKFWKKETGESMLQLRADDLSDSKPMDLFWFKWHRSHTGSNSIQEFQKKPRGSTGQTGKTNKRSQQENLRLRNSHSTRGCYSVGNAPKQVRSSVHIYTYILIFRIPLLLRMVYLFMQTEDTSIEGDNSLERGHFNGKFCSYSS